MYGYSTWIRELESLVIDTLNIKIWNVKQQFTEENFKEKFCKVNLSKDKKIQLSRYYSSLKIIVDGLNSNCMVSEEIRLEIANTLLLPIAEIEKRKREKAE